MRICLDASLQTAGGGSTFIGNYLQQLEATSHGHELTLITTEYQPYRMRGAENLVLPKYSRQRQLAWSQFELRSLLTKQPFDAYHSLKLIGPLYCPTRSIYRVAAVGQFCGIYPQPWLEYCYWNYLGGRAYRRADLIIAVSEYIRQGVLEYLGLSEDRVVTVHNGISPLFRPLSTEEYDQRLLDELQLDRPFLLCAGNLVPVKNFRTALRAFAVVCERGNQDHVLVLAGSPRRPEAESLHALASELGISHRVRFAGYQDSQQMLTLYNAADLMIHPSLHEGMSFSIVEAMACGLPLILSRTTSLPETAADAALYAADPYNVQEFAAHIEALLGDRELQNKLSAAGLTRAQHFTWQRCIAGTLQAYERLS